MRTDGNIIRNGTSRGVFLDAWSTATMANDYVCGMTSFPSAGLPGNGISTNANAGQGTQITVSGTTSVYNAANGVSVNNNSNTSFGAGSASGSNAFTRNGGTQFQNMTSPQTQIQAANNQWQDCGNGAVCGSVSSDFTGPVFVGTPQPHRNPPVFKFDSVTPTKVAAFGALIRIQGAGFNAIEGYIAGGNCSTSVEANNTCDATGYPTGTCVRFETTFGSNNWIVASVESVTPTELVVKWPFSSGCSQKTRVNVRRLNAAGGVSEMLTNFCTN